MGYHKDSKYNPERRMFTEGERKKLWMRRNIPCPECSFKAISEGALKMHQRFIHGVIHSE